MQPTSLQELQDALQYLDPNCCRDDWVKIAMGIKHEFGDAAFNEFDNWSMAGDSYKADSTNSTWKSISAGGGVTIATVFKMASDNGYSKTRDVLSPEEIKKQQIIFAKRAAEREAQEAKELAERKHWHSLIAKLSNEIIKQHTIKIKSNKYLTDKKVNAYGVLGVKANFVVVIKNNFECNLIEGSLSIKQFFDTLPLKDDRNFSFLHIKRGDLVVPLIDVNKKLWNIQVINASGTKMFLKHGRKSGCFHFIGKASSINIVAVVEGYATGASVHMATNWPVAVALDVGNLAPVAQQLKQKLPDKTFIFCADNDVETKGNPGITKANLAANSVDGVVAVPDFSVIKQEAA